MEVGAVSNKCMHSHNNGAVTSSEIYCSLFMLITVLPSQNETDMFSFAVNSQRCK